MKSVFVLFVAITALLCFTGCANMPTPTSQIAGAPVSGFKYQSFNCVRLKTELDFLSHRENQLVVAQEQRIKRSKTQAFWWGYGQGDGQEASHLAKVRGEKEAIRHAMNQKGCNH